ncbi:hypothetical protein Taro_049731 [Colocasia esculenta]|uniref:Patellin-3 n=1 Tax=Colocasia esculenta TaxID=4460 RepID=A0A843XBX3_COLES|nr:hypothetical protein [Colocasia esculenta]
MAEETPVPESEAPAAVAAANTPAEVLVTLAEEKPAAKEAAPPPPPAPEAEEPKKPQSMEEKPAEVAVPPEGDEKNKKKGAGVPLSVYFKEESNVVADLEDVERKALGELKQLVRDALANLEFTRPPPPAPKEEAKPAAEKPQEPSPEVPKADEPAAEAPKVEEPTAEAPAVAEKENLGEDTKEVEPPKAEDPSPPAKEEPLTAATEEKPLVVDEDGAKTVEAIEETVIPVAAAAAPPLPSQGVDQMAPPPPPPPPVDEVLLWGVPLMGGGEKSDTVLLKFLRARDFKAKEAMAMLKQTVRWREEFGIEGLLQQEEELRMPELEKVVFMQGHDREGHPVCYNVFGEFQNEELYKKVFSDEEKRGRFLRWRIRLLEKGIREQLDFSPTGVCSMVQVNDLKNSPGLGKRELRVATKQALDLLQDNYPEFVAKQVCINVPWWYMAFHRMISPFLTQRTKSKFVFAGPYIAPEQVPIHYGGLSKKNDPDFGTADPVTEFTIKPSTKHTIVIPASEACVLVWELRVLGWDVSYGAEFVPSAEDGYTVIVHKARRYTSTGEEPFVKSSFKAGEPGKVVLTVDNPTSKKKKLLYRCKTKKVAGSM